MFNGIQKLEQILLVTVPRDFLDDEVLDLRRNILRAIRKYNSEMVVLDFQLVDICDSFFGRFIYSTSKTVQLMGASVIIAGLQDAVIETMVEMGMTLPEVEAVLDLDEAIRLMRKRTSAAPSEELIMLDEVSEALELIGERG
jgi:rsbT antagonist protein RsbS